MAISARLYFVTGALFLAGSLTAGLVHCAQDSGQRADARTPSAPPTAAPEAEIVRVVPLPVPADARCPVCGMYPARFGRWAAQIVLHDGSARFFDSPREMLLFHRDIDRYGKGLKSTDIAAGFVSDFSEGGWVNAQDALFVRGSDLPGPMGTDAFPAFARRTSAAAFVTTHGGEVLGYLELRKAFAEETTPSSDDHHGHHHAH